MQHTTIRTTHRTMRVMLESPRGSALDIAGAPNLLFTGAKARYLGGGHWRVAGYASDGRDVERVVQAVTDANHLRRRWQ